MNELEQRLLDSPSLPTIPRVAQRLLELLGDDEVEFGDLAEAIRVDPALAAKVIRLINSAMYGLSREITSIDDALLYLGLKAVRSVALSFSLLSALRGDGSGEELLDNFWRTSLMNALASRRLAAEVGGWDPEEAFLSGLLADCGVLLLFDQLPDYAAVLQRFHAGEGDLGALERDAFATDHARVGGLLLERWSFPERLREQIAQHHDAEAARRDDELGQNVRILHAAWQIARALTVEGFAGAIGELEQRVAELTGIAPAVARSVVSELPDELRDAAACFEIPAGQMLSYEDLLVRANQHLSRIALEADQSARELAEALSSARSAFGDLQEGEEALPLDEETGLPDANAFTRLLERYHERARQIHRPIGVLLIRVLSYKMIVEHEGEETALEGIQQVAERVAKLTRQGDQRARVTEDQIALLAPGCSANNLLRAAERILFGVEERALETRAGPLLCKICIGIAVTRPHEDALDAASLLALAQSALDRAEGSPDRIAVAG
ncbi:MAG: HDOD domain-containing protein [Myxococcota bacterium]